MCVIDSDYIDEGGSGNPQGMGFLSISMLFSPQRNYAVTQSEHCVQICLDCIYKINLIKLPLTVKPHVHNNNT